MDFFSAPYSLGARSIDVACLPCPTSQTRHKDQVKITRGCSNPLKAVTPRDFYLRAKRKQNCGEKLRKYHLYLNAKAHLTFSSCSLSCMTKHPSLPGLFPALALKAPEPGKFLSPGPTRPTGRLLLPFSVKQTKCVRPSAILGEKVITIISL